MQEKRSMKRPQHLQFTYDGKVYSYELHLGGVRRLNLRVRGDGSIRMSAPIQTSQEQREAFLRDHILQLVEAINRVEENEENRKVLQQPEEIYRNGGVIIHLGRTLNLRVIPALCGQRSRAICALDHEFRPSALIVTARPEADERDLRKAILKWKKETLLALIESYCEECIPALFAETLRKMPSAKAQCYINRPTAIRVHAMTSRWGSCNCNTGVLNFNLWLINSPIGCIEYVIVHEFAHFIYPNHSAAYHSLLSQLMPDWKERKKILNQTPVPCF